MRSIREMCILKCFIRRIDRIFALLLKLTEKSIIFAAIDNCILKVYRCIMVSKIVAKV